MATNKIDYDVLEQVANTYGNEAETISSILTELSKTNQILAEGVQNETCRAFLARYDSEHKKALEAARDAIAEISSFVTRYRRDQIDLDRRGASAIGGR